MKLKQIEIGGFGKWTNKIISFDDNFQVVFGLNEAGKSTMYQFIRYVLFEHEMRKNSQKDFQPRDQALYGGRLIFTHRTYGEVKVERFKGYHKGQARVFFEQDQIGDQEMLKNLLAPLNLALFDEVFSLQQEELLNIINLNEEKLQELLLTIGLSGSQRLALEQDKFMKNHEKLYRPGARVRPLNQEIAALRELETQISQKEQLEQGYREQMRKLQSLKNEAEEGETQLAEIEANLVRYNQQVRLWPNYEERQQLIQGLALEDQQFLSEDQLKQLESLEQEQQFIHKQIADYQQLKESQLVNGQLSPALIFYQNNQNEIDNLAEQHPKFTKLQARLDWLQEQGTKQTQNMTKIRQALAIEPGLELPQLTQTDYQLVQKLARRQEQLQEKLAKGEDVSSADRNLDHSVQADGNKFLPVIIESLATFGTASLSYFLGYPLMALIIIIAGIGLTSFHRFKLKESLKTDQVTQEKEVQANKLADEQVSIQKELAEVQQEKEILAQRFVFSATLELDDWLYLWPQREQLITLEAEHLQTTRESQLLLHDLSIYQEHLKIMSDWLPVQTESTVNVYQQLLDFVKEMRVKQQDLNRNQVTNWHEPLKVLIQRKEDLPKKLAAIVPGQQSLTLREIPLLINKQDWLVKRQQQLDRLNEQLEPIFNLEKKYELSRLEKKVQQVSQNKTTLKEKLNYLQKKIQGLDFSLKQQEADGTLAELYQARENLNEEIKTIGHEWLDNRIGEKVLQDLLSFLGTQHLSPLLATATHYFKELTLNKYKKCEFIAQQLQVTNQADQVFSLGELSTGSQDQLYLAIRLAFIHLHSQEQLAPVIIDDGWLHYDSQRKLALFKLLVGLSREIQVICLSSDRELMEFAEENYLPVVRL